MADPRPTDHSGSTSRRCLCGKRSCQWCREVIDHIDRLLASSVQPLAPNDLPQKVVGADTLFLEECKLLQAKRDECRRNAVKVKRLERKVADSQKKRKALGRKLGLKLGGKERELKFSRSQVEAQQKEIRSLNQKLEQCQKGKELSEQQAVAQQKEIVSLALKLEQCQKGKELTEQQAVALQKENRSLKQELEQRQKEPLGQANPLAPTQRITPWSKLDISQDLLALRELLKEFNRSEDGKKISAMIMSKLHTDPQSSPFFKDLALKDLYGNDIKAFSRTVMQLAYVKERSEKEKDLPNISPVRLSEIKTANERLSHMLRVAKTIKCPELKWTETDSEGYYYWSLIVGRVNEACHRPTTNATLKDLSKRASSGYYNPVHETFPPALHSVIRLKRIVNATQK